MNLSRDSENNCDLKTLVWSTNAFYVIDSQMHFFNNHFCTIFHFTFKRQCLMYTWWERNRFVLYIQLEIIFANAESYFVDEVLYNSKSKV